MPLGIFPCPNNHHMDDETWACWIRTEGFAYRHPTIWCIVLYSHKCWEDFPYAATSLKCDIHVPTLTQIGSCLLHRCALLSYENIPWNVILPAGYRTLHTLSIADH